MIHMEDNVKLIKLENYKEIYENDAIKEIFAIAIVGATGGRIKSAAQSMYSKQQGLFYVAYEDEKPVGIIGLKQYDQTKLELLHLAVLPEARGHRLGFEMIKMVLDYTRIPLMEMDADYKEMTYLKKHSFKVKDMSHTGFDQFLCTFKDNR